MDKKMAIASNLRRYGMFRCVIECRAEVAKYIIPYSDHFIILG